MKKQKVPQQRNEERSLGKFSIIYNFPVLASPLDNKHSQNEGKSFIPFDELRKLLWLLQRAPKGYNRSAVTYGM